MRYWLATALPVACGALWLAGWMPWWAGIVVALGSQAYLLSTPRQDGAQIGGEENDEDN